MQSGRPSPDYHWSEQVNREGLIVSRYELKPTDPRVSCAVAGWERTFGTFFAQVWLTTNDNEDDAPDHDLGCDFREITEAKVIVDMLSEYAEIPDGLVDTLNADAAREGMCEVPAAVQIMSGYAPAPIDWENFEPPF
jgi:hypothetical protein